MNCKHCTKYFVIEPKVCDSCGYEELQLKDPTLNWLVTKRETGVWPDFSRLVVYKRIFHENHPDIDLSSYCWGWFPEGFGKYIHNPHGWAVKVLGGVFAEQYWLDGKQLFKESEIEKLKHNIAFTNKFNEMLGD